MNSRLRAPGEQDWRAHEYLDIQFRKWDIGILETVWKNVTAIEQKLSFFETLQYERRERAWKSCPGFFMRTHEVIKKCFKCCKLASMFERGREHRL